ncbi:S8 family peptidase [uncultured Ruegeria sp.]|uniref:S8 family peptidase n=1 Tax=uncultured Ruegeria sp. TaxID=259304 RepID=UPI00262D16A8|nr:S8 family peptidase [uncultured Ruegeria sp.]
MFSFRKLILTTPAIVTLATAVSANIYSGQLTSYSDEQALKLLISEHALDPSTFEDAHEYITLNRPTIMKEYLRQTSNRAPATRRSSPSEPSLGATSGNGLMIVLGVAGMAVATSLAGGGGNGDSDPDPSPFSDPGPDLGPSPSPSPNPTLILGDAADFRTPEFNRNYGLSLIEADERYAKGGQGQGVKISILDTGIDVNNRDFLGKIDFQNSYSYFGDPSIISDTGGHGTHVAGIAAGRKDGRGTHGVAFRSELVIFKGIRGNDNESSTIQDVWADALNRSIDAGAHVMNNSWVYVDGNNVTIPITDFTSRSQLQAYLGPATINALNRAKSADLISVVAAGNHSQTDVAVNAGIPHLMPKYNGYFIAAVAVDRNKRIAGLSNRCGVAKDFCLAAPGVGIISTRNGGGVVAFDGTSMAAPHVTGGYALLKSQWPELTAPQISQIMFDTADDLGDPGVDEIYGQGFLNLSRAMRPVGELVVYQGNTTKSEAIPLAETGIAASGALAPALNQALTGQVLMVTDEYTRGFDLAASALVSEIEAPKPRLTIAREVKVSDTLTVMRSNHSTGIRFDGGASTSEINLGDADPGADPFGQLLTEDYSFGHKLELTGTLALIADHAFGSSSGSFTRTSVGLEAKDKDGSGLSAQFGLIEENSAVLGSRFMGAAGQDGRSSTSFLEISGSVAVGQGTLLTVSGTQSTTDFQQAGLVTGGNNLMGRAGQISISKKRFLGSPGTMSLSVSSPLQISSGEISIDLPQDRVAAVAGQESTGVTRTSQTVDITSSVRPIDIGLTYQIASDAPGSDILFNAGYRARGGDQNPYFGFALSHSF